MAVYLSPGVFPREIDLSLVVNAIGPLRPAFIGTAKKGPMNVATYVTNSTQALETFGEPFPESYFMYAMLAYLEEGNACYGMRVGVECEEGQPEELDDICVDTSGGRGKGWGRIPLFTGIDYGRINLRAIGDGLDTNPQPYNFHDASVSTPDYNDVEISNTFGPTSATLETSGAYTGSIDDSFVMIITSPPDVSSEASVGGSGFQIVRNSDGEIVAEGTLTDDGVDGTSQWIDVGDGVSVRVNVSSGVLDENDTFTWSVVPDNRSFSVSVEGDTPSTFQMPIAAYTTVQGFVDAANTAIGGVGAEPYVFVEYTLEDGSTIPQIRTSDAGDRIQLMTTKAWALEVGTEQYSWDIPRSYLIGVENGPFDITSQNNRMKMNVIGESETKTVEFSIPIGLDQTAASVSNSIDSAGVVAGDILWDSFELTIPQGTTHVVIVASEGHQLDTLQMLSNYSNLKTLRFAETLGIQHPYKKAYRGFTDNRVILPSSGELDAATPLSCESDLLSDECISDTAYYASIVGYLVAPTPGTWVDGFSATLEAYTEGVGNVAGRYKLTMKDNNGQPLDIISDISFDKTADRYVGNMVNPGSKYGGINGNAWVNWEDRPAYLDNDPNLSSYVVRQPSQFYDKPFVGQANGIPTDPAYSSELDSAIIGNPSISSGLYGFQNPEAIDINLLVTPGFSSGAVIGTALQVCEARGDVLYIVDPPFGLRPQQVVDWHNGMLLSDMSSSINSSYGALYWGWLKTYDQFNSQYVWVPPSGHITAVFSRTARDTEQWFAPAGLRRGRLLSVLDVEYSPSMGERDLLYGSGNAVNPIVKFPQEGLTVWGQRTLQRSTTALDRVNVRMLLIYIKKNLTRTLRNFIFEPNDKYLWAQVRAVVNPFLGDIQARRGLQAYNVICDETNNTPERMDRNELWVSAFLKPTRAVEFVVLNLVIMRSGASFGAEEVLAAGSVAQ